MSYFNRNVSFSKILIPTAPEKNEKVKNVWSFVKSLKKTRLGSLHSEKMEF